MDNKTFTFGISGNERIIVPKAATLWNMVLGLFRTKNNDTEDTESNQGSYFGGLGICLGSAKVQNYQDHNAYWESLKEIESLENMKKLEKAQNQNSDFSLDACVRSSKEIPSFQKVKIMKSVKKDKQDSDFDLSTFLKSLERIEQIKEMSIEELASLAMEIHEPRLLFPRTEDEMNDFKKLTILWDETIKKIRKLVQEAVRFKENNQQINEEKILAQKLSIINKSLVEIDSLMTQFCAVYRYFPLNSKDSLLLIYDFLEEKKKSFIKGIFFNDGKATLLEPSFFPKELTDVSSPEHFTCLLKNAHIQMKKDPKDLTKSTFCIIQRCPGGEFDFKEMCRLIEKLIELVQKIQVVIELAVKLLEKLGLNISEVELKCLLGGLAISYGATSLFYGVPFAGPGVALGVGLALVFSKISKLNCEAG